MTATIKTIASDLAEDTGISKATCEKIVRVVVDIIAQELYVNKNDVYLHKFGTFKMIHREERDFQLPNGKHTTIPEKDVVKFKESKGKN